MTDRRSLPVPEGLDGLRLDAALSRLLGISRTVAADIIDAGGASLDGTTRARSDRVAGGAWLEVELPAARQPAPPVSADSLPLLYQDDDLVAIDKPAGVAAHPSPGWTGPTVTATLAAAGIRLATSGAAERQGIVHRLDVGTTGIMVVAKSEAAYAALKDDFRRRRIDKRYRALVQGHPDPFAGTVDAPLDRAPGSAYKFAVVAGGRPSVTHYETVEAFRSATLLDVRLETGRTHQIRVHLAALRHPCCGDLLYGADPTLAQRLGLSRQALHAADLRFEHPTTGRPLDLHSPDPPDLAHALEVVAAWS